MVELRTAASLWQHCYIKLQGSSKASCDTLPKQPQFQHSAIKMSVLHEEIPVFHLQTFQEQPTKQKPQKQDTPTPKTNSHQFWEVQKANSDFYSLQKDIKDSNLFFLNLSWCHSKPSKAPPNFCRDETINLSLCER